MQNNGLALENRLNQVIGAAWRKMPAEKRQPYEDLANKDLARYWNEWLAYKPPPGAFKPPHRGSPPPSLGLPTVLPTRPKAAYMWFLSTMKRINESGLKRTENFKAQQKVLGAKWSAMPAEQRLHFEQLSERDRQRYTIECETMVSNWERLQRERLTATQVVVAMACKIGASQRC